MSNKWGPENTLSRSLQARENIIKKLFQTFEKAKCKCLILSCASERKYDCREGGR